MWILALSTELWTVPMSKNIASLLHFGLAEIVDVERFPPLCQDLLFLLSLCLLLCSPPSVLLDRGINPRGCCVDKNTRKKTSKSLKLFPNILKSTKGGDSGIFVIEVPRHHIFMMYLAVLMCISVWWLTLCWTPPYCWVMLVRTFFFLASSSCFFRASSCSFLSFSSCGADCTGHRRKNTTCPPCLPNC